MGVDVGGRAEREELAVEVEVDADLPLTLRCEPVEAVRADLRIHDVDAAVDEVGDDGDDVPVGVHVDLAARLVAHAVELGEAGLEVLAPLLRADGEAVLHTQVIAEVSHRGRVLKGAREFADVVLQDDVDEHPELRRLLGEVDHQLLEATEVTESQPHEAMGQACAWLGRLQLADCFPGRHRVAGDYRLTALMDVAPDTAPGIDMLTRLHGALDVVVVLGAVLVVTEDDRVLGH